MKKLIVLVAFAFGCVGYAAATAFGQTIAAPTSAPVIQATQSVDTSWDLVAQYGPIWGSMLLAFAIGARFVRANDAKTDETKWIAKGRVLAIIIAVVGVLGSVVEAHFGGTTWAGVIVTLVAGIKMIISPQTLAPAPSVPALPPSS